MSAVKKIINIINPVADKEKDGRDVWPNRAAFILAAMGGAVGLGNVLRYPSVVFANSGVQWFIPYLIALFFLGIPVLLLEISLGQAYRASVVTSFNSMHNRARGVGLSVVLTGYMVVCYYVPILSWIMHYFRTSFQSPLPWAGRGQEFYMDDVIANQAPIPAIVDGGRVVQYASYPGMGLIGETVGWCAFIWFCVWLCMFKGIALTGRAVWVTMGLPVVMIFVLVGGSASLDRSIEGVRYYFGEWHGNKLSEGQIWQAACGQVFFSIGVGFGYFTTYSSFNPRFAHAVQDTLIIAFSNSLYEVIAGFVVFSIIGFLRMTPEVDGESLSTFTVGFLTYPLALVEMPASNFFSVIWFLTIALLGLSSAVALIESFITMINESAPGARTPRWMIATALIVISFLISLVYCTEFGFYFLDAVDTWVNDVSLPLSVWSEIVSVSILYRYKDVVSQIGWVSYLVYSSTYVLSMFLGVLVGHVSGPEAGAGMAFGLFIVGTLISVILAKTPDSVPPSFWAKNVWLSKLWWITQYSTNQLRRDLNVIVGAGKNWNIPVYWGPILRYGSAPILAMVASFAYPKFYEKGRMDPLHICGFTFAHITVVAAIVGVALPRALDVFVIPEKRDDWKAQYAPQVLMPTLVARSEGHDNIEEGATDDEGVIRTSEGKHASN
ncbi:related to sodium-dependent serotonin transporter [Cephalotrichum gorgonifer]|uniref:Related to sodium-dependent serotonin transporter n=1 Tax=Cephalotrichum gorgonifer TaxID=2041049 RepID=A0AAE8MWV7_9PEZI|nr:related to sodium-dependent serotonin transporter [Cephalotrichum gorgonifer]